MLKRIWPESATRRLLHLAALALLLCAALAAVFSALNRLPDLASMNIGDPPRPSFQAASGDPWVPAALRSDGFAEVAANDRFVLYLDPKTSQIAVENKRSGYWWRSNPTAEELAGETAKGLVLQHLQSPFILEYVSGTQIRRLQSNALDPKLAVSYVPIEGGVQVTYDYPELSLSFAVQYRLTEYGFELRIPEAAMREDGDMKFVALNPLPYFGAVYGAGEEGYLFVPDGPGGLIRFDRTHPSHVRGYEFPIYGEDPSHLKDRAVAPKRENIAYPVFGLARGGEAYAAIVDEGRYSANIKAVPAGVSTSFHSISVNFIYRQEYGRKVSGLTDETVRTMEQERVKADRRVEYRLLSGDDADYVGMARAYRQYLLDNGMLGAPLAPVEHTPLLLTIIGGGEKRKFGGMRYETATTFAQAEEMVEELEQLGVRNLRVHVQGWQSGGRRSTDRRFPIAKGMGGTEGARQFVDAMKRKGIQVLFEDSLGWKHPDETRFSIKKDGVRSIDSTVLRGRFLFSGGFEEAPGPTDEFIVHPALEIRGQKEVIDKLKDIGVDGIHYADGPGNLLFSDYNPGQPLSRADTAYYYQSLLTYARETLGAVSVGRGNDYALRDAARVVELPLDSSHDLMVDTTVPFYPIALHGYVEYTARPGNLRDEYDADFLKAVEYGAIPYFQVTHEPSRVLMGTDYADVYSSEFAVWKERIAREAESFDKLSGVYHQPIADHEQVADGVFVTTYEDGTKVIVDYNKMEFHVEGGGGT